jgi:glycosyltransferase involved in cell wall biosynthesis
MGGLLILNELRILHPDQIYPTKSGGYLRTFNIAKIASKFIKTSIFSIDEMIEYNNIVNGVNIIQEKKYENRIYKLNHFLEGLFSKNYSPMNTNKAFSYLNPENTIFQIEEPSIYNLLKRKGIKKFILDEHNVCWELLKFPSFGLKYKIYNKLAYKRDKKIEIEAIKNASHILTCSMRDKKEIIKEVPETDEKITIIPNCVNFSEYDTFLQGNKINDKDGFQILFMGLLSYSPNTDAVYQICDRIAPNFGDDVQFIIIGSNPPNINKPDNVKFLGYVDDIKWHILNSDICIAPLRYGSGTRLKILEYMAMGKPVISTAKGVEGIDYIQNKNIVVEDNIDFFTDRIKELLESDAKRKKIGKRGMELIKQGYDWKIHEKSLIDVYEKVLDINM